MNRFYLLIWLQWVVKLTLYTLFLSAAIALAVTFILYAMQGFKPLNGEVVSALVSIFGFWFAISWNFALLLMLFRSLKYIFNRCIAGYTFQLLTCPQEEEQKREVIESIGYGDLIKVWRRWFMLIIWLVGAEMILALIVMKIFSDYESIFEWFNIYLLYLFIIIAGYFSFIVLSMKCKKVRIRKC